jgi:riboflavin kinase/FMN adenylyltransferase
MKVVTSLADAELNQPSVLSIGNFDGVHLGHQAILKRVIERSKALGIRPAAMTFSPHPIRFLSPDRAPRLILTLDQKIRRIADAGIELLFIATFDAPFSRLTPEEFIRQYLVEGLKARSLCVGGNFNFGYRQGGTVETLRPWSDHFEVIEIPPVVVRRTTVSSSQIRTLVAQGQVSRACRLLGGWIEIEGDIVSGAGRGKSVTVPTLNLRTNNELLPRDGVYVSRISLDGEPFLDSITNVGVRPTFGDNELSVETFVLSEAVPSEVKSAKLKFIRRLRDEVRFPSPEALRYQIIKDVDRTRRFFQKIERGRESK